MKGLYVITDCENLSTDRLLAATENVLRAGVAVLQYRDKSRNHTKRQYETAELRLLCREYNCLFIINDDVQLAKSANSDGVHLGSGDCDCNKARNELGPGAMIGVSCYNRVETALAAADAGADYIAFGSFYPSPSKQDTVIAKPGIIKQAKRKIALPIVAIGGITPSNCRILLESGADLLAVISSIYQADDPYSAAQEFNRLIDGFLLPQEQRNMTGDRL